MARAKQSVFARRARDIVGLGHRSITSHGVGGGQLEYAIKQHGVRLTCTEITPQALTALSSHFTECDAFQVFDMSSREWPNPNDLHVLHRLDTEATDDQWREIFANIERSGIRSVLFIPAEVLTPLAAIRSLAIQTRARIRGRKLTFCGWFRSEAAFLALFPAGWAIEKRQFGDLVGFILTR